MEGVFRHSRRVWVGFAGNPYNGSVKKLLIGASLGFLVLGSGCHRETPTPSAARLRVSLFLSHDVGPQWVREDARIGRVLDETFGAEVVAVRVFTANERRTGIEAAASQGSDLVVCVGSGFDRSIQTVAPRYPRTAFVIDHGDVVGPNVSRMEFLLSGAAYLGGVTAAVLAGSTTGVVDLGKGPVTDDVEAGFEQGFRCRFPWGKIQRVSGVEGIEILADNRVMIALCAAGEPHPGLLAFAEASGVQLVTVGQPVESTLDDAVIAAIVVDVAEAVSRIAADVVDDTFIGRVYAFDLGSGVVDLKLHPSISENVDLQVALDQGRAAVNAGMVEIEGLGL